MKQPELISEVKQFHIAGRKHMSDTGHLVIKSVCGQQAVEYLEELPFSTLQTLNQALPGPDTGTFQLSEAPFKREKGKNLLDVTFL